MLKNGIAIFKMFVDFINKIGKLDSSNLYEFC